MQNHIRLAAKREPPEGVLRQLRSIDPSLDLHYLGGGRWAVGAVKPNAVRRALAHKILQNMQDAPNETHFAQRHRLAELAAEGFGVIAAYKFNGEPTAQIVEDVRSRQFAFMHRAEREFASRLEAASTAKQHDMNATLDEIAYRERNVAPQLFRAAHSVSGQGDDFGPHGPRED